MNKLPDSCYIGKIIPKDNFKNCKDELTRKIERIRYMYLINDKTSNYNQTEDQNSIVVISLSLKDDVTIENIIKEIEKSINYNIIYEIEYNSQIKYGFYDGKFFTTNYEDEASFNLLANSVEDLHENIKKQILGTLKSSLSSEELVQNNLEIERLIKEIEKLESLRKKEKQMNKKNLLRKEIKILNRELEGLNNV